MNLYRNREGYSDPTAGAAMANILREERLKRQNEKDAGKGVTPASVKTEGEKANGPVPDSR